MNWAFDADVQRWDAYGRDAQIGRLYPTHEKTISNRCYYKLINANKLKDEHEIIKILDLIRIDLTPKKKNLLQKNKPEVE